MKSPLIAAGLLALVCATTTTACSGSQPTATPTVGVSATPAVVAVTPTPTPTAATSAPTLDAEDLKALLLTSKDLGKSWGASAGGVGTQPWYPVQCPQPARATTKVDASARFWQGFFSDKSARTSGGVVISLAALPSADGTAMKTAYEADLADCKTFSAQGYYSVDTAEKSTVEGADEVIGSYTRRLYGDKARKQLVMVFRDLVARKGSVVVEINAGYPAELNSPVVKNFDTLEAQMTKQLTKISTSSLS